MLPLNSSYIDALRRCHALNFSGGKTNAGFLLTNDGRFVLKQMVGDNLKIG